MDSRRVNIPNLRTQQKAKSTPFGSVDRPFNPVSLAIGSEATFVARSVDVFQNHLKDTLRHAAAHKGSAYVEILQNCNIFNDGAWFNLTSAMPAVSTFSSSNTASL